jgi:CRISPR/Cas system endoribonuclease Cas6 (RAMP superfamily)
MKQFKIKLEDKAVFLNRLEKADTPLSSNAIEDNKLEGYFIVSVNDPEQIQMIKTIIKQSPSIDLVKEHITIKQLKEIIREELRKNK